VLENPTEFFGDVDEQGGSSGTGRRYTFKIAWIKGRFHVFTAFAEIAVDVIPLALVAAAPALADEK